MTQTLYSVDPTKQVLVRQFGAIVGEPKTEPGLYAKIPLVQDIQRIDRRLLDYEAEEFEIIAGDQKRLVVDAYARYKIVDAKMFAQTVPGGEPALRGLLDSLINSEIRGVLQFGAAACGADRPARQPDGRHHAPGERQDQGTRRRDGRRPHQACRSAASQLPVGFQPHEDRPRARGRPAARRGRRGEGQRINATADREVAVIRADAGLKAQITMGEADGEATKIYADAFNKDKDFYAFWRRMEAYKQAFGAGGGTMVLNPDSDFFRYFNDPAGLPAAKK